MQPPKAPDVLMAIRCLCAIEVARIMVSRASRIARVVAAATLAASFGIPTAAADKVTVRDKEENLGFADIAKVSHGHSERPDGSPRIRHTITLHERWRSRELCYTGRDIEIHIRDTNRTIVIYYREKLQARVYDLDRPKNSTVGWPRVWRTDRKSVTVSLRQALLGNVGESYRWDVGAISGPCNCEDNASCPARLDRVPNRGYIRHEF